VAQGTGDEYKSLLEDIKVNGLIDQYLCMKARFLTVATEQACIEPGIEPRFEEHYHILVFFRLTLSISDSV